LQGYRVYGTDLSDKMIDFSKTNLDWLAESHHVTVDATLHQGDAMDTSWQQPIDIIACESYLGQPFSAPPSLSKLAEVRKNCDHIITTFLQNISHQITSGTPLCVAVPAWRDANGAFIHLPLIDHLESLGYHRHEFKNVRDHDLLYYREDQIVARELLVLVKA
jgi:tRNA G10  N-methylase Trm11